MRRLVTSCAVFVALAGCQNGTESLDRGLDSGLDAEQDLPTKPDGVGDLALEQSIPPPPSGLEIFTTGDSSDFDVQPKGPALLLMGGGPDVYEAFMWWKALIAGGDVIVLRVSGGDGYNTYLYDDIGGCDSVETLKVTSRALADDPFVRYKVASAEGIFIAGGDQADYLDFWKDTALEIALQEAYERGAVLGGTSAGLAILGQFVYSAENGTVYSDEALSDPYDKHMTLARGFLGLPLLAGAITDSHFRQRNRMGRLVAFVARIVADGWHASPIGIGVDEETALLVDAAGAAKVVGEGTVYLLRSSSIPLQCVPGKPLTYEIQMVEFVADGGTMTLPGGATPADGEPLFASDGNLDPADPY